MSYKSELVYSNTELSKAEKVYLKDTSDAIKLDEAVQMGESLVLTPKIWAVIKIHNDKSEDKEYENYILVDESGDKYVTGSESFWRSFTDIAEEMSPDVFSIKVFKKPSKNYSGKAFITCGMIL